MLPRTFPSQDRLQARVGGCALDDVPAELAQELGADAHACEALRRRRMDDREYRPEPGVLGCTLNRQDRASGRLGFRGESVDSFTGRLTFAYKPSSVARVTASRRLFTPSFT